MTIHPDPTELDAVSLDVLRSTLPFDICCTHRMPDRGSAGRCQLWAGHDGDHALLFVRGGARLISTWLRNETVVAHDGADYRSLPWARGFPLPAWHEPAGRADD